MCTHSRSFTLSLLATVFAVGIASAPTASAVDGTWLGTTSGTWATTTNWSASPVPGGAQTATFNNAGNGNTTLDLGAGVTIKTLTFDTASVAAYTIGSGGAGFQTLSMPHPAVIELTSTVGNNQTVNANLLLGTGAGTNYISLRNNSTTNSLTLAGSISGNTSGAKQVKFDGAGNVLVSGAISNGGTSTMTLEQVGTGNTTLAGVNSYSGALNIGAGTLTLSGTLNGNNTILLAAPSVPLGYAGTGTLVQTSTGVIGGSSSVQLASNGYIGTGTNILGGNNSYSGNTSVGAGILRVTHDNGLGSTAGGTFVTANAQLQLAGGITIGAEALSLNGSTVATVTALVNVSGNNTYGGNIIMANARRIDSDAGTLTLTGTIAGASGFNAHLTLGGAGNIAITGNIGNDGSARGLIKDGTGIVTLTGSNSYTGATTVSNGILTFGGTSAKATNTVTAAAAGTVGLGVGGAGFYTSANLDSLFANTLTGFSMNAASGVAIDTSAGDFVYATNQNAARALTKLGANSLTLTGTSGYTGATVVNAGTLIVAGSLTNTASATVRSGAALRVNGNLSSAVSVSGILSGTGSVGAVTVASGGTLAPGNSAGVLNATSLSGTSGAILSMEIGKVTGGLDPVAGLDYDQLNSSGGVTLSGMTLTLTSTGSDNIEFGDKIFLVLNGSGAVGGTFAGLAQDQIFLFGSQNFQISYEADWTGSYSTSTLTGGNDIALLAVVPEPSTCLLLGGGLMFLMLRRHSRKMDY